MLHCAAILCQGKGFALTLHCGACQTFLKDVVATKTINLKLLGRREAEGETYFFRVMSRVSFFFFFFQVNITVEDENDNPPVFDRQWYEGSIEENSPPGTEVKMEIPLRIHDADTGMNSHFSVNVKGNGSDLFAIDQKTLKIAVKEGAVIDREYRDVYYLRLVARDKG